MIWTILAYESGRHTAVQNSLCRVGVTCVIPMVEEWSPSIRRKISRPALPGLAFVIERDFDRIRSLISRINYLDKAWAHDGNLDGVPDYQFQAFLDRLERREKKAKKAPKTVQLGELAERDWFKVYADLYGVQAAIRRFGRDLREPGAPAVAA